MNQLPACPPLIAAEALRRLIGAPHLLLVDRAGAHPVVAMCGSGITACHNLHPMRPVTTGENV